MLVDWLTTATIRRNSHFGNIFMGWFGHGANRTSGKHLMGKAELFRDLSDREMRIVDGFVHTRQFLPGEVIFDAGEEGQALYVIVSGKVAISLPGRHDAPLALLHDNDFFGELGLLDDWPRSAQTRAVEMTELAVLFRGDFERLMESDARIASKIAMQLARHLGQRLRQMLEQSPDQGSVQ
jgi:CRP-like cAMP-binding protein